MSRAKPRKREQGNTMVLSLIILSALGTLGTLTVISVQSSLKASTNDRAQAIALYAAESGAAYAMDYLRYHYDATPIPGPIGGSPWFRTVAWKAFLNTSLDAFLPTSPFGAGIVGSYETKILNNKDDYPPPALAPTPPPTAIPYGPGPMPNGYLDGNDYDGRVIIQVTGHGPQEATAIVEVEVQWPIQQVPGTPAPTTSLPFPNGTPLTLIGWHVVNL
jgi:hypothetical protein